MVTIRLMGGLGNQMFQYALGRSLESRGKTVQYSTDRVRFFNGEKPHDRDNPQYGLDGFHTKLTFGKEERQKYVENNLLYHPNVFDLDNCTLVGYWQNEKYFSNDVNLVHEFFPTSTQTPQMKVIGQTIIDDDTTVLQIRRGDYTYPGVTDFHGLMGKEYFEEGLRITGGKKVVIFTDDEKWCRDNFPEATIGSTGSRHWDIFLMAGARNIVISNSTFAWWGAWLGDNNFLKPGRRVVAPKNWFKVKEVLQDITPQRWITI